MKSIKKTFLPGNFEIFNEICYYRLEDGKIAVEEPSNVTINTSKEDVVKLIILECDSKKVKFWATKGKIYALASSSFVTIPEDITFVDCYFSDNYPEGQYIKYKYQDKYGILYVSETEVNFVISHEKGYVEINYENNYFYAEAKEGNNRYHIIGESGKLLGSFNFECKKLHGYRVYYDEKNIYIDNIYNDLKKIEIPGGVLSVECVESKEITFIKVINKSGVYYYTQEFVYLFGPIQEETISAISGKDCFVYELVENKIKKVFYIKEISGKCHCEKICSKNEIKPYFIEVNGCKYSFFEADNKLYMIEEYGYFKVIIENVKVDNYEVHYKQTWYHDGVRAGMIIILGYKKNEPVYLTYYNIKDKTISFSGEIENIRQNIYRNDNNIVAIRPNGEVVFFTTGTNAYKKQHKGKTVYIVEINDQEINIYNEDGKEI